MTRGNKNKVWRIIMCSYERIRGIALGLAVFGIAGIGLQPGAASAAAGDVGPDVPGVFVPGNPTCSQLISGVDGLVEFKINDPADGNFLHGTASFEIDVRSTADGPVFDWEISGGRVYGIVAKGGPNANLYDYAGNGVLVFHDDGLHSPTNPSNGKYYGLSHVSFCYVPGAPEVEVGKVCVPSASNPSFDAETNMVHTVFDVTIENTGVGTVYDVTIEEAATVFGQPTDSDQSQCSLTAIGVVAVEPPVVLLSWDGTTATTTAVKVADSLAEGATLGVTVECDSSRSQLSNIISVKAKASAESPTFDVPLATHTTTAAEQCALSLQSGLTVAKECTRVSMVGGVVPQVCVDITVTNTSPQHVTVTSLENAESGNPLPVSLLTDFVAANNGSAVLQEAGDADDSVTFEHCYTPAATGSDPQDPEVVNYPDTVTVTGVGVFDEAPIPPVGDPAISDTESCQLCPSPQRE
ncbi:hypothetical protein [Thauera aromatica]|uniref:hypothetical protein n=1 Tax=Thauera aromatica TaxID=59405 RepID=UPI001FFC75D1|nr:hypothetical protein [Thauera aromatica]MCK2094399.1 hypothetical protein [Thauera aromatica]